MYKAKALTTAVAFVTGSVFGGATLRNLGAKDVDQTVKLQMVLSDKEAQIILGVVERQACPKIAKSHGAECNLCNSFSQVRFDLFLDPGGVLCENKSMRMHPRFRLPGKFKAK